MNNIFEERAMDAAKQERLNDTMTQLPQLAGLRRRLPGFPVEHDHIVRLIADVHLRTVSLYNDLLRKYGIGYRAYATLMIIYASADLRLTPSEIIEASGEKKSNMTRLADELIFKGLISRTHSLLDRRSVVLCLTSEGEALIAKVAPQISRLLRTIFGTTEKWECEVLGTSLGKQLRSLVGVRAGRGALQSEAK